jgi:hypothetical protein
MDASLLFPAHRPDQFILLENIRGCIELHPLMAQDAPAQKGTSPAFQGCNFRPLRASMALLKGPFNFTLKGAYTMRRTAVGIIIAAIVLSVQVAAEMSKSVTVEGWVSDTECAAHGVKNCNNKEHLQQGAKLALVADADGKIWTIENPEKLTDHMGHHVKVKGEANAETGTLSVERVSMTKEMKGKEMK